MTEHDSDAIAVALEQTGYAILPKFLHADAVDALATRCRALDDAASLAPATTGRLRQDTVSGLRGDRTQWLDAAVSHAAEQPYWMALESLRTALNRRLLLGLEELEAHYALYPAGAGYVRHRDRFRDDDARVVSSVLYLNAHWGENDGGTLRLYLPDGEHDVAPCGGTLVLFLSAEIEHEVLPATRQRLSIAGWFRRRALGDGTPG